MKYINFWLNYFKDEYRKILGFDTGIPSFPAILTFFLSIVFTLGFICFGASAWIEEHYLNAIILTLTVVALMYPHIYSLMTIAKEEMDKKENEEDH